MNRVTVLPNQTIFDLAIQCYGAADGLARLVEDNGLNDLEIQPGQELLHSRTALNATVTRWYAANRWQPVSERSDLGGPDFNFDYNLDYNS